MGKDAQLYRLPDAWMWDFWLADDGELYHLFFLYASRALKNPEARHLRASIGHAISTDLTNWRRTDDALVRSDPPAFDDVATWTGSIGKHPDGTWFLFYTGGSRTGSRLAQTIGYATSSDLISWTKNPGNPVVKADPRWYETLASRPHGGDAFRDPWVFADPDGNGWHMLITARATTGPSDDRGIVGHAWSPDLRDWHLRPPLSDPSQSFSQLEVTQVELIDGQAILLFSCLGADTAARRRETGVSSGVWAATGRSLLGPYDIANAQRLTDESLYSGRIIQLRNTNQWNLLAFHNNSDTGEFVGTISDPQAIRWDGQRLMLERRSTMDEVVPDGVGGDEQPVEIAGVVEGEGVRGRGRQRVGSAAVEGDAGSSGEAGRVPQALQVRPDGQERPRPRARCGAPPGVDHV